MAEANTLGKATTTNSCAFESMRSVGTRNKKQFQFFDFQFSICKLIILAGTSLTMGAAGDINGS